MMQTQSKVYAYSADMAVLIRPVGKLFLMLSKLDIYMYHDLASCGLSACTDLQLDLNLNTTVESAGNCLVPSVD